MATAPVASATGSSKLIVAPAPWVPLPLVPPAEFSVLPLSVMTLLVPVVIVIAPPTPPALVPLLAAPPSELYQYAVQKGYINDLDKYLESLDKGDFDWEFYRYHSRHFGSDVNLSEFATKDELRAYVMYCLDLVKLRRLIHRKVC